MFLDAWIVSLLVNDGFTQRAARAMMGRNDDAGVARKVRLVRRSLPQCAPPDDTAVVCSR